MNGTSTENEETSAPDVVDTVDKIQAVRSKYRKCIYRDSVSHRGGSLFVHRVSTSS